MKTHTYGGMGREESIYDHLTKYVPKSIIHDFYNFEENQINMWAEKARRRRMEKTGAPGACCDKNSL